MRVHNVLMRVTLSGPERPWNGACTGIRINAFPGCRVYLNERDEHSTVVIRHGEVLDKDAANQWMAHEEGETFWMQVCGDLRFAGCTVFENVTAAPEVHHVNWDVEVLADLIRFLSAEEMRNHGNRE